MAASDEFVKKVQEFFDGREVKAITADAAGGVRFVFDDDSWVTFGATTHARKGVLQIAFAQETRAVLVDGAGADQPAAAS